MKYKIVLVIIIVGVLFSACQNETIIDPFEVKGDIEIWQSIDDTREPLKLNLMIDSLKPIYDDYDLVISSRDGFSVKLAGDSLFGTTIEYAPTSGWMFTSDHHPVNSRVKWISEVVVVKKPDSEANFTSGINFIHENKNNHWSLGQLLSMNYSMRYHLDGTTEQEGNAIDVMKKVKYFSLNSFIDEDYQWLLVMDASGAHHYISKSNYAIELQNRRLDLRNDQGEVIEDIVGIIVNPPRNTVMDNYYDAMNYIEKDIPVMTVFLDGFSFDQWQYMKEEYPKLYMSNLDFMKATTVFKPVTNAGFAAMVSGRVPADTGIMDRSVRRPECKTIYDNVNDGILVDGLVKILDIPCQLYLENDDNQDGYTDSETFTQGMKVLGGEYILIHFNGIDDAGHDYGPFGEETITKMIEVDYYVEELVSNWYGKVIILADHGMHKTDEGGDHGEFRVEDMMVPYILINGGQYEQTN